LKFITKEVNVTLSKFIAAMIKRIILGFAFIVAIGKFGITIAPLIAELAATAFGASFAIQGPLANYGAALVIFLTRPFVVGNTIKVTDIGGIVDEVKLDATVLTDEDRVKITIPNKHIVGEIIHNSKDKRIVEEIVVISLTAIRKKPFRSLKRPLTRLRNFQGTSASNRDSGIW
jgi:small conductance mechanosensitive channel